MFSSTFPKHVIHVRECLAKSTKIISSSDMWKKFFFFTKITTSCLFIVFYRAFYSTYEIFSIINFYLCDSLSYKFRWLVYLVISILSYNKILKCVNKWRIGIMSFAYMCTYMFVLPRMQYCIYSRVNTYII